MPSALASASLQWPSNKPSYYVYKPLSSPTQRLPIVGRLVNSLQLLYYKYLLHTGLYMLSWREQTSINSVVVICAILGIYWIVSLF